MESLFGVVMCADSFIVGFGHNKSASAGARKGRQMRGEADYALPFLCLVYSGNALLS